MVRVIKECGSIADGVAYMACNTIASLNLGALPVHVDGAKGAREPTAELCTTRWAASLRHLSTADKVAELAAAREAQPLLGMSLWLRPGLSLDVTPASGLAIVPGTEGEHGVPEPLPDADGRDLERGFTRSRISSRRRSPKRGMALVQSRSKDPPALLPPDHVETLLQAPRGRTL